MKKILRLVMAAALVLTLTGCGPGPEEPDPPETQDPPDEPTPPTYQTVEDAEQLPGDIQVFIPALKEHRGYHVFGPAEYENGDDVVILIFAGEKPTGGYDFNVEDVEIRDDTLRIVVEEIEPREGDHVIQVLTYPMIAVQLDQEFQQYEVVNTEGVVLEPFPPGMMPDIREEAGIYQGLQDSSSLEILVNDQPMALRFLEHHSAFDDLLNFGDEVTFHYYQNEHGQNILVDIKVK